LNNSLQAVVDRLGMDISNYFGLENDKIEILLAKIGSFAEFFKVSLLVLTPIQIESNITINIGNYINNTSTINHNYAEKKMQNSFKLFFGLMQSNLIK
jgi:hypothetical protein